MTDEIILDQLEDKNLTIAAIGNFDGLHIAHQMLMRSVHLNAHKFGRGKALALSFEPHPLSLLNGVAPKYLIDKKTKKEFIEGIMKCDEYIALDFNSELASMSPEDFVKCILVERLHVDIVFVGFNFTFGKNGVGTAELLNTLCEKVGIRVIIAPPITNCHGIISSTMVREQLESGDLDAANRTLRYWYTLRGEIIKGNQFGRTMGFATANIAIPADRAVPPHGVYAVRAVMGEKTYNGIANLGVKPTVCEDSQLLLETHLFNFLDKDLYGKELTVYLGYFIRPEIKFADVDHLRRTVKDNMNEARQILAYIPEKKHLPIDY